ncbi:MAG: hypothetical protein DWI24_02830 [Planctomycetota bacterium]|nr:MAG: hypothetical protein DWI24_02830 [Planctomycetota bacterium]
MNLPPQKTILKRICRPRFETLVQLVLILALAFVIRWPMMIYAYRHMDSDLAVDGLTLREFVQNNHWRWHYPGTPHIGTLPMLISLPAVAIWGDGPEALVFAGVAANLILIIGLFLLIKRAYGIKPACCSALVLAAGGLGQVWLSARVTGGHLLAAAWISWGWLIWSYLITKKPLGPWLLFGLFCAVGIWADSIFLLGMAGLGMGSLYMAWSLRSSIGLARRLLQALLFIGVLMLGPAMSKLGDGYNAYGSQFEITTDRSALWQHARILGADCLPRLLVGRTLEMGSPEITMTHQKPTDYLSSNLAALMVSILMGIHLLLIFLRINRLARRGSPQIGEPVPQPVWLRPMWAGLMFTSLLTLTAFEFNKNIFNADNYRYLIPLIPLLGCLYGLFATPGRASAMSRSLLIVLAILMSLDVHFWQAKNGFHTMPLTATDEKPEDIRKSRLISLLTEPQTGPLPAITGPFEADYWETYRALYLASKPVTLGKPFGFYPNRFPDQSPVNPKFVVISSSPASMQMIPILRQEGARLFTDKNLMIYERATGQPPALPKPSASSK